MIPDEPKENFKSFLEGMQALKKETNKLEQREQKAVKEAEASRKNIEKTVAATLKISGLFGVVSFVMILMKLMGTISYSWWIVTFPLWGLAVLLAPIIILSVILLSVTVMWVCGSAIINKF